MPHAKVPKQATKPREKKFFSVEAANKTLPLVRQIVGDVVEKYQHAAGLGERLELLKNTRRDAMAPQHREEVEEIERDFETAQDELKVLVEELQELGVDLKGADGLIDFPARFEGREICLCWKLGEPDVQFWHDIEAGYGGRQRLTAGMEVGGTKHE